MFKYYLFAAVISITGGVVIFLIMSTFTEWDNIDRDEWRR